MTIRVTDNDKNEISVWHRLSGTTLRSFDYSTETERRTKMILAREFAEGWYQAEKWRADNETT